MFNFALPEEAEVGGKRYPVRADFRVILEIFVMLDDPDLSDADKTEAMIRMFYVERPEDRAAAAFDKSLNLPGAPRMATPYMHHYYVTALLKAGLREQAEEHLRTYWGGMLAQGADTFWECWDPENPGASPYGGRIVNSHCHAWSCTPVYLIEQFFS